MSLTTANRGIQVTYKLKQQKKKAMESEMKFGVNVAAPFAGMKRDEGSTYPYAKQVSMFMCVFQTS